MCLKNARRRFTHDGLTASRIHYMGKAYEVGLAHPEQTANRAGATPPIRHPDGIWLVADSPLTVACLPTNTMRAQHVVDQNAAGLSTGMPPVLGSTPQKPVLRPVPIDSHP